LIPPGEHIIIFGMTGSGKSSLTRQISEYYARQIIFDRKREWKNVEGTYVFDFKTFSDAYRSLENQDAFRIVVQFRPGISADEFDTQFGCILNLLHQRESGHGRGLLLLIEEVWLYSSPHYLNDWLKEIILTGRDPAKITLLMNSQRPASVHKDLTSQSQHFFIGQYFDVNDALYFRQVLGESRYKLSKDLPKFRFVWFRPGSDTPSLIQTTPLS
jgi:DNA helicase HerA-like ATPase